MTILNSYINYMSNPSMITKFRTRVIKRKKKHIPFLTMLWNKKNTHPVNLNFRLIQLTRKYREQKIYIYSKIIFFQNFNILFQRLKKKIILYPLDISQILEVSAFFHLKYFPLFVEMQLYVFLIFKKVQKDANVCLMVNK